MSSGGGTAAGRAGRRGAGRTLPLWIRTCRAPWATAAGVSPPSASLAAASTCPTSPSGRDASDTDRCCAAATTTRGTPVAHPARRRARDRVRPHPLPAPALEPAQPVPGSPPPLRRVPAIPAGDDAPGSGYSRSTARTRPPHRSRSDLWGPRRTSGARPARILGAQAGPARRTSSSGQSGGSLSAAVSASATDRRRHGPCRTPSRSAPPAWRGDLRRSRAASSSWSASAS